MKSLWIKFAALTMSIALVGCSTNTQKENTTVGAVTGAVAGGLVGSAFGGGTGKIVAVGLGAVAGALIGGEIGNHMQSSDNSHMTRALTNNNPGKTTHWTNKKTGAQYTMTPIKTVAVSGYSNCREFETTMTLNGNTQTSNGTACRMKNGHWKTIATN